MLKKFAHRSSEKVQPLTKEDTRISTLSRSKYQKKQTLWRLSVASTPNETIHDTYKRRLRRNQATHKTLLQVALLNAVLSLLVSALGYVALQPISRERENVGGLGIWLKAGIATLAMIQVSLLLLYHSTLHRYEGSQQHSLRLHQQSHTEWKLPCLLEYGLHLFVLVPEAQSIRILYTGLRLNDCLYMGVLLRNYDIARVGFWLWGLDAMRIQFYQSLMVTGDRFLWKLWLNRVSISMIIIAYLLLLGYLGVFWDVFSQADSHIGEKSLYDSVSTLAFSQSLLGFGFEAAHSFLSQFTLVLGGLLGSCFLIFLIAHSIKTSALTNRQEDLYRAIMHGYDLVIYREEAVCLLQSWWKTQLARRKKRWMGEEFAHYYIKLVAFRATQAANVKDKGESLRVQLKAIDAAIHKRLVDLREEVKEMTQTRRLSMKLSLLLLKSQHRIAVQTKFLIRPRHRLRSRVIREQRSPLLPTISEESEVLDTASVAPRRLSVDCSTPSGSRSFHDDQ